MATINLNKGVVDTNCTRYNLRVHEDDGDAWINTPDTGACVEFMFYARSDVEETRRNSEKSLQWSTAYFGYIERLRNVEIQKKIKLRTGAIELGDTKGVFLMQLILRRTMVWIKPEGSTTWEPAYCDDQTFSVIDKGEKKEYEINLTYGRVEYVTGA